MTSPQNVENNPQFERYGAGAALQLTEEISCHPTYRRPRKQRFGLTPMGVIALLGKALGHIAHGQMPWWVAIASWFVYGIPFGLIVAPSLQGQITATGQQLAKAIHHPLSGTEWFVLLMMSVITLFSILVCGAILSVLVRGTLFKLRRQK
ncbi:hypothetical protein [Acaryochloris sp. IP29b_bin.137]|uniref:hypothetical protein n=1 Tax=Acaryochloris sp. IP29b_bin.137 TaxID=2969217 RepID=UPI00260AABE6|nr:hypothetical protein [Acaryochloris sp. IP29b_bin.137]